MLGNLDIGDRSGKTALHHAAYSGHLEMLSLLQLKGANVKALDKREKAPLHLAAFMGMCMREPLLSGPYPEALIASEASLYVHVI